MPLLRILAAAVAVILSTVVMDAQQISWKPYGFIKGDAAVTTAGVQSFFTPGIAAPQTATGVDTGLTGFTAQHSRIGMTGEIEGTFRTGALVEMDFFTNTLETNLRPRMRLAYAWVRRGPFELRIGQQWDLFSANNPLTNNTNGNLWYGGNLGFRRAMIQLRYTRPGRRIAPAAQVALCEGTPGSSLIDNYAPYPMLQGRLSATLFEKHTVGLSFVRAAFSPVPDSASLDFFATGLSVDATLPFHDRFSLHGEFSTGRNLAQAGFFTIAQGGGSGRDADNTSLWVNVQSKLFTHLHLAAGLGMDRNTTDKASLPAGSILGNTVLYADIIFPFGNGFSLSVEGMHIATEYKNGVVTTGGVASAGDEERSAWVFNLSGRLAF
ncbi:MAG: hypothetical protein QHI48_07035 [Bacteroidota bacterium]|nr:hypothetical protein [Bacteroidota bacterium]